jgi:hypothetical protein
MIEQQNGQLPLPDMSQFGNDLFSDNDAENTLASNMVALGAAMNSDTFKAYHWLKQQDSWCGTNGEFALLADQILQTRHLVNPGLRKAVKEALDAVALKRYLKQLNLNLGGK